ncbi:MAG TPA: PAS domain S-box protein [Puia sp.]|jgi:PAS domain S-box-containing protein|nr:PAS domain S-box protein [Puia sp.]
MRHSLLLTQQHSAKEHSKIKKERLIRVLDEIKDYAIVLLDQVGTIESWNKGAEIMNGYRSEEITGKNFSVFYSAKDKAEKRPQHLLRLAAENSSAIDESWETRKDGSTFWGEVLITSIHDHEGNLIGFSRIVKDLTAVKQNQELIRAAEERYSKMLAEIQDYAIILLDKDGNIENWNLGAETIKGYASAEAIGKNFRIFYPREDQQNRLPEMLLETAVNNNSAYQEGWRVRKDGSKFWASVVITALHNANNEVIGFSKVTKDLTDKKLAEERQATYIHQKEIRSKEMQEFAYIASHDLHEPLRTIKSFLELFELSFKSQVNDEAKMYIGIINESVERMQEMIKGVMDYSVLGMDREVSRVDISDVVEKVKVDLSASISSCGANICAESLPVIQGYRNELYQLFQNLISNAIKFKKPDLSPVIEISATPSGDKWLFKVKDNGIGMDSRFIEKIFLIFQKLHSRDIYGGTGIGLAYAKKIVEMHNGRIWAESTLGSGSTFYFLLSDIHFP